MAKFKYSQADWKFIVFSCGLSFLTYKLLVNYLGFGLVLFVALVVEIIILALFTRYFVSVVEFRDSSLIIKKAFSGKTQQIPYSDFEKLSYSNATRFLKLSLYTNGDKIELPPPARLAQAKELFAWLKVKNPTTAFEIIQPKPTLD